MEKDLFPQIITFPLSDISAPMLLSTLRRIEARGANETAHTLRQTAGQVFRYGVQTGRCDRDPAADLHSALKSINVTHMAAVLEPAKAGELLRAINGYSGQPTTRVALQLSALPFQRPGNIRQMEWGWVDFDRALLTIPGGSAGRAACGSRGGGAGRRAL
jgi:integrase